MAYRIDAEELAPPPATRFAAEEEEDEGEDDFEGWSEGEQPTRALFVADTTVYPSPEAALAQAKADGCDLRALVARLQLDTLQVIRLINHVRRARLTPADVAQLTGTEPFLSDNEELQPVPGYENDGLLQLDFDDEGESDPAEELALLRQAYHELRMQYAERVGVSSEDAQGKVTPARPSGVDVHYFDSYAGHDIHQTMIADSVRTLSYAQFILSPDNAHLLRGKTVMDVGCGSGILSLFCARAGAKQVLAIDASEVAMRAEANVAQNGFGHVVRVFRGKIEELDTPLQAYVGQVDFLVSEWMGYFLLYESMLPSVLYARDRYLKAGGTLAPSHCRMLLAAATDRGNGALRERFRFWDDVYGFAMPSMTQGLTHDAGTEEVEAEAIVSKPASICELPLEALAARQPEFVSPFELECTEACPVYGLVAWFDTWFLPTPQVPAEALPPCRVTPIEAREVSGLGLRGNAVQDAPASGRGQCVSFTTSPFGKQTHWKQTVFLLKTPIEAQAGTRITGEIRMHASEGNTRELDVEIHYDVDDPPRPNEKRVKSRLVQLYSVR
ncbi:type I protein arginine methyltransferase [Malassezia obtusa]|uniref:type I protein arginine methyltransferase n=1 Tax=Malassezia obtusa TaxID=76774 RepID=A0AAF0E5I8_9BASI|nr:type I protein arginine methyltransferase [Malassezia obtusa]